MIRETHPDLDYLILEGGTNDADLLGMDRDRFGTVDPGDFSGVYDDQTFCGACESLLYKAAHYFPRAKIGVILAQKMGAPAVSPSIIQNRRRYFLQMIQICRKWSVPYLDLWETSPLDPLSTAYYDPEKSGEENKKAGSAYTDGQHLTAVGYDLITPQIEAWVRSL